jgi:hypothetical protein
MTDTLTACQPEPTPLAPLPCSQYLLRLPGTPTKDEIMFQLERMIHQWDDAPETVRGYHPDALWLEEVRSIIHKQDQEAREMRDTLEHIVEYWNRDENEKAMADALWYIIGAASDILANGAMSNGGAA